MLSKLIELAEHAGEEILKYYGQDDKLNTQLKADDSPITAADRAAHGIIAKGLKDIADLPLISEEGELPSFDQRRTWHQYWLVDPLDGTKEFLSQNGEFTVNIALIEAGRPILGVVVAPVLGKSYWGGPKLGAFSKAVGESESQRLAVDSAFLANLEKIRLVSSRRHGLGDLDNFITALSNAYAQCETLPVGSSLKLCRIAEAKADIYPRYGLTSEWDTAAGLAVLLGAGGEMLDLRTQQPIRFNQSESILQHGFLALGAGKSSELLSSAFFIRKANNKEDAND